MKIEDVPPEPEDPSDDHSGVHQSQMSQAMRSGTEGSQSVNASFLARQYVGELISRVDFNANNSPRFI